MRQIPSSSSLTASPASTTPQSAAQAIPNAPQSASIASASALFSAATQDTHISSWIADTGASAHMTFNRHWMRNMTPHRIPIRLADGSVIHSEGIGSVQFTAVVHGQEMIPLEFTNVLYVPTLSTNLLSVLYLTMHRSFTTLIEKNTLHFIRDNRIQFQAQVTASNSALPARGNHSCAATRLPVIHFTSHLGFSSMASSPLPPSLGRCQKAVLR